MTEEKGYDLGKSAEGIGKLVPILKDKKGNIIDGFHRQEQDPNWPTIIVESIDSDVKLELARLATNFCRRKFTETEWNRTLRFLLKSEMKIEDIAEQTGIPVSTIYYHMPQDLKDQERSEAIKKGIAEHKPPTLEVSSKTQDISPTLEISRTIQDTVPCDRCQVSTSNPTEWHNHNLCETCLPKAQLNPESFDHYFHSLEKPEPKVILTTDISKPLDSWEHRKAQMSPQHSKMEMNIIASLIESGVTGLVQDRHFCVLETIPDIYLPAQNLAIYLDGEVHNGKQDRDEQLRGFLRTRHGVRVFSYQYDSTSQKEVDRVTKEILSVVKVEAEA